MNKDERDEHIILAVDDTATNLTVISNVLSPLYEMKFANSAAVALKVLEQCTPSLILLDIMMPEMDGYELIKVLKEREQTRRTPVIFITVKDTLEDEEKGLSLGASDYINKPIAPAILKLRVKNQLEIVRQRQQLEDLIHIDHLTQIPNRRQFDSMFKKEWMRSQRSKVPLTLYMIDVDFFKTYNDFYGHALGDEVLKMVASSMKGICKRGADFLARWGGEEFALLVTELDAEHAAQFGEKICTTIEQLKIKHSQSAVSEFVTVSIGGLTVLPGDSEVTQTDLLTKADELLYQAKENGRNRAVCATE